MDAKLIKAYYVYSIIFITTFDYDKYYQDLYRNALKYGMTSKEFWYELDYKDYFIYEEAYYDKLHETAHIQGLYNYIALQIIAGNILAKKGAKPLEYPSMSIYTTEREKRLENSTNGLKKEVKITKENLQQTFMNRLANCY